MPDRRLAAIAAALALSGISSSPSAEDLTPAERMQEQMQRARERMLERYQKNREEMAEQLSARMEAQYRGLEERMERQRERFRRRVVEQWADYQESAAKKWVDYSDRTDARSIVDFEKGEIELEVLVPAEQVSRDGDQRERLRALAEEKIREQAERMVTQKEAPHAAPVLQGQIARPDGQPATRRDVGELVKEQLAPQMVIDPEPVVAADKKPRIKVKVKMAMVPEHLQIRAARYSDRVKAQADKLGLPPALVFAVIHTESSFNPMARSGAGAFGLMQLIPKGGAHDAYRYLHKKETLVTPEYLYDPDNNITLGATYLYLLKTAFFGKLKNPESGQVLSIAAYNWGPGNVKKKVMAKRDVDSLSPEEVVQLLQGLAPQETRDYVERVRERMALYREM